MPISYDGQDDGDACLLNRGEGDKSSVRVSGEGV